MAARKRGSDVSASPLWADFSLGKLLDVLLPAREVRIAVRRPDDLLVFDLVFDNLRLRTDGAPRLERRNPAAAAHLIVELPPQSFAEQAFLEVAPAEEKDLDKEPADYRKRNKAEPGEPLPPHLPVSRVRMAGRSRLAFIMLPDVTSLPYTLEAVLKAMRTWEPSLSISALPDPEPSLRWPGVVRYRDWLSPASAAPALRTALSTLSTALVSAGARGVEDAIAAAGQRVAERAAGGLTGSARRGLGRVMFETLHGEMEGLVRRFPELRDGPAHQAALAALSLASGEALAPAAARVGFDIGMLDELPLWPLLLRPHEPARHQTALELPYRLILSPIEQAHWLHRDAPAVHRGRTELWHTRLTAATAETGPDAPAKVRALWSADYPEVPELEPTPFRHSLDALDRRMLVQNMAGFDEVWPAAGPRASRAKRLHLSALGGLLDVEGSWEHTPDSVDLKKWRHQATLGRDHDVRVEYSGYLCSSGHRASLVKVTERKFQLLGNDPKKRVAVLRQRFFIECRERIRHYPGPGHEFAGHNFPFREIEILTEKTPSLLDPGVGQSALEAFDYTGIAPRMVFWPMVPGGPGGVNFRFRILATDINGKRLCFTLPLLFVSEVVNLGKSGAVRNAYNASPVDRRQADFGGSTVCYAPYKPDAQGDPRLPTSSMTFAAGKLTTPPQKDQPHFHPETERASCGIPAHQKMLGRNDLVDVTYPQVYKEHAFGGSNPGEVFLQLVKAHGLAFGGEGKAKSDTLGALAAPQMSIVGLSRIMGPVAASTAPDAAVPASALDNVVQNRFDPADFFPPDPLKGAKILGGVDLGAILGPAFTGLTSAAVPKMLSREHADRIEASFEWNTEIKAPDPLKLLIPNADGSKPATRLVMQSRMTTPLAAPGEVIYTTHATLNNFKVNLFGFIILWFENLQFQARQGQKPDVTVELRQGSDAVQFGGPLEFVNTLRTLVPSNGFSDPPSLAVTPSGISASYSLNLPSVQVGLFALSNMSLGAAFELPFDARPASVRFNFSERQRPFSLTVAFLGGGGFFAIGVSARGVQEIEAALEFGAALAIDLGVASGGVEIKAGVYFHWLEPAPNKGSVELAGYVRLHGELSVLGIISASLTFLLKLAYLKQGGKSVVWGEAELIIEIEILFFSMDVSVRCRREFGGSESDPKFIDLVPDAATWTEYCEAFAEEAA